MAPLLHRQPFKAIYLAWFAIFTIFIHLPYLLIYYSWRPNRPRKAWSIYRAIIVRVHREVTLLPVKFGLRGRRDLSLEVPQENLESYNSRFTWIPELEEEDIVGVVAEYAAR